MNVGFYAATQRDLFGTDGEAFVPELDTNPFAADYNPIPVHRSTFKAGLSERVHSWFRLTPSFGPDLVRTIIEKMELTSGSHIHDPFSGAATTAIEAALEGYRASCLEINPFLHFVGKTSLRWELDADVGRALLERVRERFSQNRDTALAEIGSLGVSVPPIHNIHRWWREDVLRDILALKSAIRSEVSPEFKEFFELVLAAVLVPDLTNVTLGRLQLHFINRDKDQIDVWHTYESHALRMFNDLEKLHAIDRKAHGRIVQGDATKPESFTSLEPIDAVITSPPYPNRYSYVWNTRPHLYMLDIITAAKEASQIDQRTIGGTWGTATSELAKGVFSPINAVVEGALAGIHTKIAASDQLMANYVTHYFNRLEQHLSALAPKLKPGAKLAYVVGNSRIKEQYVATDVILAKLIEGSLPGATIDGLHRFRRRNSAKNLFETIVYARI